MGITINSKGGDYLLSAGKEPAERAGHKAITDSTEIEKLITAAEAPKEGWKEALEKLLGQKSNHSDEGLLKKAAVQQLKQKALVLYKIEPKTQAAPGTPNGGSNESKPETVSTGPADPKPTSTTGGDPNATAQTGSDPGEGKAPVEKTDTEADPISMVTGEELLALEDFTLPGPIPFTWRRVYRSTHDRDTGLGHGWTHGAGERLQLLPDAVILHDAEGRRVRFKRPLLGQRAKHLAEGLDLDFLGPDQMRLRRQGGFDQLFTRLGDHFVLSEIRHPQYRPASRGKDGQFTPERGYVLRLEHNAAGRLIRVRGNWGRGLGIDRDELGRMLAVHQTDAQGQRLEPALARYAYSAEGDLISHTDALGATERYAYDNHVILKRTLKTGFTIHWEWDRHDTLARCQRNWGEDGILDTRFTWDPANNASEAVNSRGVRTRYRYDEYGHTTEHTDGEGGRWQYEYKAGRRVGAVDPEGRETRYLYDAANRLAGYQDALGQNAVAEYFKDRLKRFTDVDGAVWEHGYDTRGQLNSLTDPGGATTHFEHDLNGLPSRITDAAGRISQLYWNEQAELIRQVDALGNTTEYAYDAWGRVISQALTPMGGDIQTTHYSYNALGQVTGITNPEGERSDLIYNDFGHLIKYTDPQGRVTEYHYDPLGHVLKRIDPEGQTLAYEYDTERNLTALVNENGERHCFEYDGNERLIKETGFDGREQHYRYNAAGELIEHVDADTVCTRLERDALGRLIARSSERAVDPDNGPKSLDKYRYDPKGRLLEAYNADHYLAMRYDSRGAVIEELSQPRNQKGQLIKDAGQVLSYHYDALGQRTRTELPDGQVIDYAYHASGAYKGISLDGNSVTAVTRDSLGRALSRSQGQTQTRYDYDPQGRLRRQYTQGQDKTQLIDRCYDYDPYGRLARIAEGDETTTYLYDAIDRLQRVEGPHPEVFAFDPAGNLLDARNAPRDGRTRGNRLKFHQDSKFEYDTRGNLIEERRGKGGALRRQYIYDHHNRLSQVIDGEQHTSYTYDPLGRRVAKKDNFGKTRFLWAGDTLIQETRGQIKKTYLFEPDSHRPVAMAQDGQVYHYHLDHLGTPREMTDEAGRIVWKACYKSWGNVALQEVEEVENNLRFQGQYFDAETGLHYNRFRYYNPGIGRFINQDPIGLAGGTNNYQYAPNPVEWVDPLGLLKEMKVDVAKGGDNVYHRLGDSAENIEKIKASGQLRGNPATNTYASDIPKVKAYSGPLPEGRKGFEFTTDAIPDKGGHPFQPTWSGNRPGVKTENGQAVISCTVTKTNC